MTSSRHPRRLVAALALCATTILPITARAEDCPEIPPENAKDRRGLAKDWFARAETAETGADDVAAVRAYSCSMKMVPHAFTAYNLARVAEKAGDLELSLESYRAYLTLKPDAPDQKEVAGRIATLETRIAAVRGPSRSAEPARADEPAVAPPPDEPPHAAPPPGPPRLALPTERDQPESAPAVMGVTEWVVAGAGAATLVGGVVTNVLARKKMDRCRANERGACQEARPLAYGSYALFGAAAAAALVDVVLIWRNTSRIESVTVAPLPGGLALSTSLRF